MKASLPAPRAVLFDLDGTLADTAPDLAAAVNKMRTDRGLDETSFELLRPVASAGARGLIGVAFGKTPADDDYDAMRTEFLDNYAARIAERTQLFDGMQELLSAIEARGISWGIVTNKPERFTNALVPLIGLGHAACVVSGDTTPHPAECRILLVCGRRPARHPGRQGRWHADRGGRLGLLRPQRAAQLGSRCDRRQPQLADRPA